MAEKRKYTVNVSGVFEFEGDYAAAQTFILNQMMANEAATHMNIQSINLIRWTDPVTGLPLDVNAKASKPVNPTEEDE